VTKYIYCKSIPRSGHHYLATLVYSYLGPEIFYCFDRAEGVCCNAYPCTKVEGRRFFLQKSHDHRVVEAPNVVDASYLIQIREPKGQVTSELRRLVKAKGESFAIGDRAFAEYWFAAHASYYTRFLDTWVKPQLPRTRVIDYDQLKAEPDQALRSVLELYGETPDEERVRTVVGTNRNRLALNPRVDQTFLPFVNAEREMPSIVPQDIVADYLGYLDGSRPETRLAAMAKIITKMMDPALDLRSLVDEVLQLSNGRMTGELRKSLKRRGFDAESLSLKTA